MPPPLATPVHVTIPRGSYWVYLRGCYMTTNHDAGHDHRSPAQLERVYSPSQLHAARPNCQASIPASTWKISLESWEFDKNQLPTAVVELADVS